MHTKNILLIIFISLKATFALAQEKFVGLEGDHTIKIHMSVNPYEVGPSLSYQYYLGNRTGIQTNISYLSPIDYFENSENGSLTGSGYLINPEFRFYPRRKETGLISSIILGVGPILKYFHTNEQIWKNMFDNNNGELYSKFQENEYNNLSYGIIGVLGIEKYFGKAKRYIFEASYSVGITNNHVKTNGDNPLNNSIDVFQDMSVSNKEEGLIPYINLRVGIGYRFGKTL